MRLSSRLPRALVAGLPLALLLTLAADAQAVNRCEGRDGRVTYTDEPCPATARSSRRVDDSPPVQVRETAARAAADAKDADAKAEAAKTDAKAEPRADAKADGKSAAAGVSSGVSASARGSGRIVASASPEQELARLDEQRARQQRQCADLQRRISYANTDLRTATGSDRASAELSLRRLQEEAKQVCPRR